jgi:hypothetical protein
MISRDFLSYHISHSIILLSSTAEMVQTKSVLTGYHSTVKYCYSYPQKNGLSEEHSVL